MSGKIVNAVVDIITRNSQAQLGPAQHAHGPAICLSCDHHGNYCPMVVSAANRIPTHGFMGKCHFHDTLHKPTCITSGKSRVQSMLGEVNAHYAFGGLACSNMRKANAKLAFACFRAYVRGK